MILFIGWAGLKLVKEPTNGHVDYYDLGYRLIQKYWNKAIASEVAKAWCVYAFNQMSIQTLYAAADLENIGSNKVLTKIGFKCIEQFSYHGVLHNWYKLEKHDFKNMI
ncbi:GNAT family N-acetyltransferase [Myroides sp. LJL110]